MTPELLEMKGFIEEYKRYQEERVALISSENVSSKLLRTSYIMGLSDQYCSRLPEEADKIGNLAFGNIQVLDKVNLMTRNIVQDIFNAKECDVRLLSGLSGLTVLIFSLFENCDVMYKMYDMHGGHLSVKPIADRLNLDIVDMMLGNNYRFNLDDFEKKWKEKQAKTIFLDSSYVLFPYPLKEIRSIVGDEVTIMYDASHMSALIAAGMFQNPFVEGADIIHSTTHKSMWGPQKSIILMKEKGELADTIHHMVKDVLVSNTHMHHIFALYIALIEFKKFGKDYAENLYKNARCLANRLQSKGVEIAAKDYGYTESNQFWIDCNTKEKAILDFKKLEKIGISTNVIFLPGNRWGLRIGVNSITRLGAKEEEIYLLGDILSDLLTGKKDIDTSKNELIALKKNLGSIKYSFDDSDDAKEIMNYIIQNF